MTPFMMGINKMSEGYRESTKTIIEQDHGTIEEDLWRGDWGG